MIDISGCDLVVLVKKAYELSRPQGLGFLHFQEGGLTDEQAKSLLRPEESRIAVSLDYVQGRAVKLTVFREEGKLTTHDSWYDHTDYQLRELLAAVGKEMPVKQSACPSQQHAP